MKNIQALALLASVATETPKESTYKYENQYSDLDRINLIEQYKPLQGTRKTVLTKKQKKARAKSKRASKTRNKNR